MREPRRLSGGAEDASLGACRLHSNRTPLARGNADEAPIGS